LYYEEQEFSLGEALLDEFESALIKIHVNPEGYEKKYKNFRQAMLNRFPYLVLFEIDEKHIVIYRFINARRHPQKDLRKVKNKLPKLSLESQAIIHYQSIECFSNYRVGRFD
jgi:hypothetical protein